MYTCVLSRMRIYTYIQFNMSMIILKGSLMIVMKWLLLNILGSWRADCIMQVLPGAVQVMCSCAVIFSTASGADLPDRIYTFHSRKGKDIIKQPCYICNCLNPKVPEEITTTQHNVSADVVYRETPPPEGFSQEVVKTPADVICSVLRFKEVMRRELCEGTSKVAPSYISAVVDHSVSNCPILNL